MSDEFDPKRYRDEYRIRVLAVLHEKSKGQEITVDAGPRAAPRLSHRPDAGAKAEHGTGATEEKSRHRRSEERL